MKRLLIGVAVVLAVLLQIGVACDMRAGYEMDRFAEDHPL